MNEMCVNKVMKSWNRELKLEKGRLTALSMCGKEMVRVERKRFKMQ